MHKSQVSTPEQTQCIEPEEPQFEDNERSELRKSMPFPLDSLSDR